MTNEKSHENRLRRIAERRGMVLEKSRRRDPRALDYGGFMLLDSQTGRLVYGAHETGRPSATLNEIERYLSSNREDIKVEKVVLKGAERLSREEMGFFVLVGQLADEVTLLQKLLGFCSRELTDFAEDTAHSALAVLFAKMLASKLWQGWELIDAVYHGQQVSKATWLRKNGALKFQIRKMRRDFTADGQLELIRNQFGYHYDLDPVLDTAESVIAEQGVEMLFTDRVINNFYPTSEVVTWSSMLGVSEEGEFDEAYSAFIKTVNVRAGEFQILFNLVVEAFCVRVVKDLGGSLDPVAETRISNAVETGDVRYPVFVA